MSPTLNLLNRLSWSGAFCACAVPMNSMGRVKPNVATAPAAVITRLRRDISYMVLLRFIDRLFRRAVCGGPGMRVDAMTPCAEPTVRVSEFGRTYLGLGCTPSLGGNLRSLEIGRIGKGTRTRPFAQHEV